MKMLVINGTASLWHTFLFTGFWEATCKPEKAEDVPFESPSSDEIMNKSVDRLAKISKFTISIVNLSTV